MKVDLNKVQSGFYSTEALNSNFQALEEAIENTLSRDGSAPNQMESHLDMNSRRIINAANAINNGDVVTLRQIRELGSAAIITRILTATATEGQTVFEAPRYAQEQVNIAVYVNGIRRFDFVETTDVSITFNTPMAGGETVVLITNQSVGTLNDVPAHTHVVADILDFPSVFPPAAHGHTEFAQITTNQTNIATLASQPRCFVQATTPTADKVGDLWFW